MRFVVLLPFVVALNQAAMGSCSPTFMKRCFLVSLIPNVILFVYYHRSLPGYDVSVSGSSVRNASQPRAAKKHIAAAAAAKNASSSTANNNNAATAGRKNNCGTAAAKKSKSAAAAAPAPINTTAALSLTPPRSSSSSSSPKDAVAAADRKEETDYYSGTAIEQCVKLRGTNGRWFVNETLGRSTFYRAGFPSGPWYKKNSHNRTAVYDGNKYDWKDHYYYHHESSMVVANTNNTDGNNHNEKKKNDDVHESGDCRIRPVTKRVFCDVTRSLRIRRILMVGDSLTRAQKKSLGGLLRKNLFNNGGIFDCGLLPRDDDNDNDDRRWSVEIIDRRENLGPNFRETDILAPNNRRDAKKDMQNFGREIPYCVAGGKPKTMTPGEYCPWHLLYNETRTAEEAEARGAARGRTLLVLNQGAHFHSMETFRESFDWFVELFNEIAIPGDIVVYRASVPGHRDCSSKDVRVPITEMTHDDFLERYSTTKYDWNLFDAYNEYARSKMEKDLTPRVTQHYLNVYNMTVLRYDMHAAAEDCLHYKNPGPIDFWNHLLFTNLDDMDKHKLIK